MAEKNTPTSTPTPDEHVPVQPPIDAPKSKKDESEPGGHYVVKGRHVNALGEPYGTPLQGADSAPVQLYEGK